MANNPIRPDIYVDYRGKRVYFCCEMCKSAFQDNPEAYLDRLPQFAAARAPEQPPKEQQSQPALRLGSLAKPTGITTLCLVIFAVCLAALRRVRGLGPRLMLRLHKIVGVIALVSGAAHATIVLLSL